MFADINEQAAKETAEKSKTLSIHPNYRTLVVHVDVTDPSSVQRMVETTIKELGRIDHCVNAAGVRPLENVIASSIVLTLLHSPDR